MKGRPNLAAAVTLFSALTATFKRSVESAAGSLWCTFVTISFVVAVTMDPLFLYLLIIDQDNKCLGTDKKSWTVFLILRSLLDFIALVHLLYRLHVHFKVVRERPLVFKYPGITESAVFITCVDVLALLPFPLLVMGVAFYKICDYGSFRLLDLSICCCVAQHLLRLFRIRGDLGRIRSFGIWFKAMVYFYLYILFSHVFGAVWYFLSIQREMSCWYSACVNHNSNPKRCIEAFYCDRRTIASRNITFLNEYCSIDISDGASSVPFNFGIYREALTSGIMGHIYFFRRSFYCFWWGLRNISNFGTNLVTSTYLPENVFVIFISMFSFLLVAIVGATASEPAGRGLSPVVGATASATASEPAGSRVKAEEKKKIDGMQRRRKNLSENLKSWNIYGDLPVDLEKEISSSIDKIVEENEDADLKNDIFSILPAETRERLQRFLCMEILRTVPVLEMMGTQALEKICDYLIPVTYKENSFIFRMGDPLDCMLFIIKGTVCTYSWTSSTSATSSKMAAGLLGEGQFYGEDLLNSPDFTQLPISTEHVKTRGKVQAFALMADDLATVVANNCANKNCEEVEDDIVEIKHCAHSADVGGMV